MPPNNNQDPDKAEELLEILQEQKSVTEEQVNLQKAIRDLRREIYSSSEDFLSRQEKLETLRQNELEFLQKRSQYHQERIEDLEETEAYIRRGSEEMLPKINEALEERKKKLDEIKAKNLENNDHSEEAIEKEKELIEEVEYLKDEREKMREWRDEKLDNIKEQIKEQEKLREEAENEAEARQRAANMAEQQAEQLFGVSEGWKESTMGAALHAAHVGKLDEAYESWSQSIQKTLDPINILGSTLEKIQEATFTWTVAIEQAGSELEQATGMVGGMDEKIERTAETTYTYGISIDEVSQSYQSLYENFGLFNQVSDETQDQLAQHVAYMSKLGVSSKTASENLDFLTKGFGQTTEEARATQRSLLDFGQAIGKGSRIVKEFNQALPELAKYGEEAEKVFKGLAEQSAETGIATQELIDTVQEFETFEGAAEAAGRLNAMLGDDMINSVDMMRKSEEERIKTLRTVIDRSGQAWESMNRYRKKSIAASVGIQNLAKAERLFGDNAKQNIKNLEKRNKTQEELAKQVQEAIPIWNKLQTAALSFAVSLEPLFDWLEWILHGYMWLTRTIKDLTDGWVHMNSVIVAAAGIYYMLGGSLTALLSILGSLLGFIPGVGQAISYLSEKFGSTSDDIAQVGQAAQSSIGGILALGAAVAAAGFGIYLAASGIGYMASQIAKLTGGQLTAFTIGVVALSAAFFGLSYALYQIGTAGAVAIGPIAALAGAALAFGAAMLMAGLGLSYVVEGFASLLEAADPATLFSLATSLYLIAGGIGALSVASLGLFAAVPALYAFSYAVDAIPKEKMSALATFMSSLTKDGAANQIRSVARALSVLNPQLERLIENINKLPKEKSVAFQAAMESIGNMAQTTSQLRKENVKNVKEIIKASKEYNEIINSQGGKEQKMDALMEAIKEVVSSLGGDSGKGGGGGPQTIKIPIHLDGRVIEKKIIDVVGDKLEDRKKM